MTIILEKNIYFVYTVIIVVQDMRLPNVILIRREDSIMWKWFFSY